MNRKEYVEYICGILKEAQSLLEDQGEIESCVEQIANAKVNLEEMLQFENVKCTLRLKDLQLAISDLFHTLTDHADYIEDGESAVEDAFSACMFIHRIIDQEGAAEGLWYSDVWKNVWDYWQEDRDDH